jgi:hypothetical protein
LNEIYLLATELRESPLGNFDFHTSNERIIANSLTEEFRERLPEVFDLIGS